MTDDEANAIVTSLDLAEFEIGFPEPESLNHPGVVILCSELPSREIGETRAEMLALYNAENNALEVAKGLLHQEKWPRKTRLFARICILPDSAKRTLAHQALRHLRNRGKK